MANTYSQITIQAVFSVKNRQSFITKTWRDQLHQYIAGIIKENGGTSLAVGGWQDHVHALFGMPVSISISDMMRTIKSSSSKWTNENDFLKSKFNWQEGFGAFSYSRSQRDVLIKYILNQEAHHKNLSFKYEYLNMLDKFEVIYDDKYLFDFFES